MPSLINWNHRKVYVQRSLKKTNKIWKDKRGFLLTVADSILRIPCRSSETLTLTLLLPPWDPWKGPI